MPRGTEHLQNSIRRQLVQLVTSGGLVDLVLCQFSFVFTFYLFCSFTVSVDCQLPLICIFNYINNTIAATCTAAELIQSILSIPHSFKSGKKIE